MRRTKEGFVPFKDDKPKDAENTDFEARSDSTPMAMQKASLSSTVPLIVQSLKFSIEPRGV